MKSWVLKKDKELNAIAEKYISVRWQNKGAMDYTQALAWKELVKKVKNASL